MQTSPTMVAIAPQTHNLFHRVSFLYLVQSLIMEYDLSHFDTNILPYLKSVNIPDTPTIQSLPNQSP